MDIVTRKSVQDDIVFYPQEINEEDLVGVYDDFYQPLMAEFGYRILRGSAAGWNGESHERRFRNFFKDKKICHALEIGTWRGVSAAIMAHYADEVTTVDIKFYDEAPKVWVWAGLFKKINYLIADDNRAKKAAIEQCDFDFAFIDGNHTYEDVKYDFELVKKCGRVLFHDYWDRFPGVKRFIDTLDNLEIVEPFAYWEDGNNTG